MKLTHLPAGLGWGNDPPETSVTQRIAQVASAPVASTYPYIPDLGTHWMRPFEPPGMQAPIDRLPPARSPAPARSGTVEAGWPRITGPGGADSLRDVTPRFGAGEGKDCERSCGCGGAPRRDGGESEPAWWDSRTVVIGPPPPRRTPGTITVWEDRSCPPGETRGTHRIVLSRLDARCIALGMRELVLRNQGPVTGGDCPDCCDFDGPLDYPFYILGRNIRFVSRLLDLVRNGPRCGPGSLFWDMLVSLGEDIDFHHAFREFIYSNLAYECCPVLGPPLCGPYGADGPCAEHGPSLCIQSPGDVDGNTNLLTGAEFTFTGCSPIVAPPMPPTFAPPRRQGERIAGEG